MPFYISKIQEDKIMIHPIYNLNYNNNKNINFKGLNTTFNKFSPFNFYMEKVFDRYTYISKDRWFPIDETIKPHLKVLNLLNGKNSMELWDINPDKSKKYIIFYHGLGQNVSSNQEMYKKILDKGYAVLAPEYGSFGKNSGTISEKTINENAKAAIEYLNNNGIPNENIGVVGFSMGSFPAIETASKNKKLRFLVLISPFNSMRNEAELLSKGATIRLPKLIKYVIKKFPSILKHLDNIFKTHRKMKNIDAPIYLIHSSNDKIVPQKSTEELAKKAVNLKEFIILEKGGHNIEINKLNAFDKLSDI